MTRPTPRWPRSRAAAVAALTGVALALAAVGSAGPAAAAPTEEHGSPNPLGIWRYTTAWVGTEANDRIDSMWAKALP